MDASMETASDPTSASVTLGLRGRPATKQNGEAIKSELRQPLKRYNLIHRPQITQRRITIALQSNCTTVVDALVQNDYQNDRSYNQSSGSGRTNGAFRNADWDKNSTAEFEAEQQDYVNPSIWDSLPPFFVPMDHTALGVPSTDLNECGLKPRPCKHRCMNTYGSYKCYCLNGYMLQPDGTCGKHSAIPLARCRRWKWHGAKAEL
ncbi:Epidermal growth factor-like protein 6 [Bagarius yarrelli]|uniref:Epidermal growth factor-like protein 6 n=1 Tax=Bagarius yarrelli TaxID=175774 RepID=A0A556TMC2_BAGYA|nr:Epidermal growth factor-like protein 6 [Bagarius yarrelli]